MQVRAKIPRKVQSSKRWKKLFHADRKFQDKLFFDTRADPAEDIERIVDTFFEEFETTIPSWELHVVREFFKATKWSSAGDQDQARAKLDDRDRDTLAKRTYPRWLTPQALCDFLVVQV